MKMNFLCSQSSYHCPFSFCLDFFPCRWQKMASYLCATMMEPAELKNCIDHRELWRGSLVIREKKVGTLDQ